MHQRLEQDERLASLMRSAQNGDPGAYASLLGEAAALARQMVRRLPVLQPQDIASKTFPLGARGALHV
jgi:hypothetical protein